MTDRYPGRVLRTKASRSSSLRLLNDRDRDDVLELCDRDPVVNVFVSSRVHEAGLDPVRLGGQMWGFVPGGKLASACYAGANLVPVGATPAAVTAFAGRARLQGRRCSSIVGPAEAVGQIWELLRPYWGQPREIRDAQPVMAISGPPRVAPDPQVRRVRPSELDVLLPGLGGDVHRGSRGIPARTGRRGRLPGPGRRADRARPRVRPDRGRPGDVQGRDRRGHPARLPGAGRLGPARAAGPGAGRGRDGRRGAPRRCGPSRPWCPSTSTTSTRRPAPSTARSASPSWPR